MLNSEIIQTIKNFVAGSLSVDKFKKICVTDSNFRDAIKDFKDMNIGDKYDYDMLKMIDNCNWNNATQQFKIQIIFSDILIDNNIKGFPKTDLYFDKSCLYEDLIPDWLSDDAMTYVDEEIIEKVPENFSEKDKKKWIKQQIKETFKYEKMPPEFAQEGVWPQDEDGKFLVFRNQKQKGDLVTYTFVNPKTKQEIECQEMF